MAEDVEVAGAVAGAEVEVGLAVAGVVDASVGAGEVAAVVITEGVVAVG